MIKTINTGFAELVLVKLPEDSTNIRLGNHCIGFNSKMWTSDKDSNGWCIIKLWLGAKKELEYIGIAHDLTEEAWKRIVVNHEIPFDKGNFCYPDYMVYGSKGFKAFDTATESGLSLLRANEVYFENPLGEKPCENDYDFDGIINGEYDFNYDTSKWINAQENTGKWVVLKKNTANEFLRRETINV